MSKLISLNTAAQTGIERLRKPEWANPLDHVKIDIIDGGRGPWVHLFSPANDAIHKRNPVPLLEIEGGGLAQWLPYDGPLPDSSQGMVKR
jgi:hypothetical protein